MRTYRVFKLILIRYLSEGCTLRTYTKRKPGLELITLTLSREQDEPEEPTRQRRGPPDPLHRRQLRRRVQDFRGQRHLPQDVLGIEAHQVRCHRGKPLELLPGGEHEGELYL